MHGMCLDVSVVNYAHGGGTGPSGITACHTWDFTGLRRMLRGRRWPDVLVCCEGERWGFTGGKGAWTAAAALRAEQREAGLPERPYVPLVGSLSQNRGPIAPVVLVDPSTVVVHQWFDGEDADAYERTRNLLRLAPAAAPDQVVQLVAQHWPWNKPFGRLQDAEDLLRYGQASAVPTVVCGDFNSSASGEDVSGWDRQNWWHTVRHSAAWRAEPDEYDVCALDMLVGTWEEARGCRRGPAGHEPGFADVAELENDDTATEPPTGPRRHRRNMRFLLNPAACQWLVTGSYHVHDFLDEDEPDSDHRRISMTVNLGL